MLFVLKIIYHKQNQHTDAVFRTIRMREQKHGEITPSSWGSQHAAPAPTRRDLDIFIGEYFRYSYDVEVYNG